MAPDMCRRRKAIGGVTEKLITEGENAAKRYGSERHFSCSPSVCYVKGQRLDALSLADIYCTKANSRLASL